MTPEMTARYQAMWAAMTDIDALRPDLERVINATPRDDLSFRNDIQTVIGMLGDLRNALKENIGIIEAQNEVLRLRRELAEAQERIRQLEAERG